ncbi:hypothetical protein [Massilia horti]|uniref:Cytochrome c family protein n=1 Tax=Massilia horti TaxID=2562153 RepID=A0A4Y9SY41_9BURK|nr:hypothetical protein [Massilia horti]TFW31352.1 hypothetical protein E4O92_14225 [Massilia horti]
MTTLLRTLMASMALLSLAGAAHAQNASSGGSTSNCLAPPKLGYVVPTDMVVTRQADANCFAWQEFIALNWAAQDGQRGQPDSKMPPASFGKPGDPRLTVWETYKESDQVFLADGRDPGPWNGQPVAAVKLLGGLNGKISAEPALDLSVFGQASPGAPWLTAQNKLLTLYERSVNEIEYNYIRDNKLYNASVQPGFAQAPGLNLPNGSIEIKAAWLELPNKADWPRFKIAKAVVTYPGMPPRTVVVGLTGLHIIHKTPLGQQFIWATFEHKQNAPDAQQVADKQLTPPYTYYNPSCNPATDYYRCVANADPTQVNSGKKRWYAAPIQVVRTTPISTRANNDVAGLNQYVWSQVIAPQSPDSVFLNYQLVNTLWSNQNTAVAPGARVPLPAPQLSPNTKQEPVANTTMETYVQNLTCLDCHASAPIAKGHLGNRLVPTKVYDAATAGSPATAANALASDYSFLFKTAKAPKKASP